MSILTKRAFIKSLVSALFGAMIAVPSLFGHLAKSRSLRVSMKDTNSQLRSGVRRRLARIQVSSVEEAFRLANRKTEIEIAKV